MPHLARHTWVKLVLLLLIGSIDVGCRRTPSTEELGRIQNEMPQVPGTETPYVLPELDEEEADSDQDSDLVPDTPSKP